MMFMPVHCVKGRSFMQDHKKAKQLLKLAKDDLKTASEMLDRERFSDKAYGFFAQQAVEKLLKAWLADLGKEIPFTHHLYKLWTLLNDLGCSVESYEDLCSLTPFAVEFRYDSEKPLLHKIDRVNILKEIRKLQRVVSKQSKERG